MTHLLAQDDRLGWVWACQRNTAPAHFDREDENRSTRDANAVTCERCRKALRGPAMQEDGWLYQDGCGVWRVR